MSDTSNILIKELRLMSPDSLVNIPVIQLDPNQTGNVILAPIVNGVRMADRFPGIDAGAQIAAAIATLPTGGGTVDARGFEGAQAAASTITINKPVRLLIGGMTLSCAANPGINVTANGVVIEGNSANSQSTLRYTGINSGVLIKTSTTTGLEVKNCTLQTGQAGTTQGIQVSASVDVRLSNLVFNGLTETTGFHTPIYITGSSTLVMIRDIYMNGFIGAGINADHVIDLHLSNLTIWSTQNNVISRGIILDSGVSGVYASNISILYGLNGLLIRDTDQGGAGVAPQFLFFNHLLADTCSGGDGILFDSTLGATLVSATLSDCWAAAAGRNNANVQVTAGANGIKIAGGQHLRFINCRIRANDANGFAITSANARYVDIQGCHINANNQGSGADAHGVYITGAAQEVSIKDNLVWNVEGPSASGDMKYAVKVAAVAAQNLQIKDNDFSLLTTGDILNANTGTSYIFGNVPGNFAVNTAGAIIKLNGVTVPISTYTASNVTTDRTYDANATTVDELADILGTLIADLRSVGMVL